MAAIACFVTLRGATSIWVFVTLSEFTLSDVLPDPVFVATMIVLFPTLWLRFLT
jgi:hypothetical protein